MNATADADEDGFSLPSRPEQVLDAYFDDQRVFSLAPRRFTEQGDRFHADWPPILRPHLDGHTHFVLKEHLSGEVLLDLPLHFGTSEERVRVQDGHGRPLAVDKFGALVRMFTDTDRSTAQRLAAEVARLTEDVNAFGVSGFVAYGSLLGAVRNGRLIGHDTDADIAYLSRHRHPVDVGRESFALERFLEARGWRIERQRTGLIRAVFEDAQGDVRHIDIFVATHDGERLFLDKFVWAELPTSALVPLSTVTLEGVQIAAPADPDAVLAATYGPAYLVPDPSFRYRLPPAHLRTAEAWFGNYRLRRAAWQRRFRAARLAGSEPTASRFVRWVAEQEPAATTFVDVGCGAGGDALWLARSGRRVIGLDYVNAVIGQLRQVARRQGLPAEFHGISLYDVRATLAAATQLAAEDQPVLFSRNLLDVLEPEGRQNFWLLARTALLNGGRLYVSFRTRARAGNDQPGFRPLDADRIEAEAVARGARVVSREDRRASAVLVLTWR